MGDHEHEWAPERLDSYGYPERWACLVCGELTKSAAVVVSGLHHLA